MPDGSKIEFQIPNAGEKNQNKRMGLFYQAEAVREAISSGSYMILDKLLEILMKIDNYIKVSQSIL